MGTRQLPTAELLLKGTVGYMCSNRGKGISYIMKLANITRLHNITCSVGYMRGILFLLKDYSIKRFSFGKPLISHDLHKSVLDKLQFILEGCLILVLKLSYFTGKSYESFSHINFNDSKLAHTNNPVKLEFYEKYVFYENLLRMLLPICKMYCGRASELFSIESIQSLGAVGYMEDSFIPGLLRDTMATSIWEGSFNTLSIEFFKQYSNKDMIKILNNFLIQDVKNMNLLDLIKEITKFVIEIPNSFQTEASFLMCELTITKLISVHDDKDLKLLTFWSNKCKGSLFSLKQNVLKNPKF